MIRVMLALICLLACFPNLAFCDSWISPYSRIFANEAGTHGFKVVIAKESKQAEGRLFAVNADGSEAPVWRQHLVNMPVEVYVSRKGQHVVTLNTWASVGFEHALVIYGENGKVIADYKLEDLLTPEEIKEKVHNTESSRHWNQRGEARFNGDDKFVIKLKWNKTLTVDLTSGKIISE